MKNFLKKYGWIFLFIIYFYPHAKEMVWNFKNIFFQGEAQGIIIDKKLNRQPREVGVSKGVIFYPLISYCYEVDDIDYCNVDAVDLDTANYLDAKNKMDRYVINSHVKVFYDEKDPSRSSLEKRTLKEFFYNSFVFIGIVLIVIFVFPRILVYIAKYLMKKTHDNK